MKLSIFTPSHRGDRLTEAWNSIKDQPFDEWVVLLNGDGLPLKLDDARVKQYRVDDCPPFVGALKRAACARATGDILLELDHDDLLVPGAVAKVRDAFERHPEAGFVYSNSLHCNGDFSKRERWSDAYGWQYREATFGGHVLDEPVAFAPTPAAVSRIWYAPDHLRAFRRQEYELAGGYDSTRRVLDDQDLMARLYLVTRFHHIDEPLYVYRVHGENAWLKHNEEIQSGVMPLYEKNIERMALVWAARENLRALDLGGRMERREGYASVDLKDAEVIADLNGTWPFADSSVGVIRAFDILEHLTDPLDTMKEIYRVLAPGGYVFAQVPSTDGRGAFQDPTHRSFWNENSFLYYTHANWGRFIDFAVRFQAVQRYTTPTDGLGVCWTVAHLVSLKGGFRPPGILEI